MSFASLRLSGTILGQNLLHQLLRGVRLELVPVATLLVWAGIGSAFFGYRYVGDRGTSMKTALHDGDTLWVKYLDPAEVKAGDILTWQLPAYLIVG